MKNAMINRALPCRLLLLIALVTCAVSANSQSLTQTHIDKYIKSIDLLVNSEDEDIQKIEETFKNNENVVFDTDQNGNITLISQLLAQLDGSTLSALDDVVESAGFDSVKEWASLGDRISAAMMAVEMEKEPVDMSELTPDMLAMMPESMRKQMEGAIRMMKAVDKVPADDVNIVKANYEKLQKHMDGQGN